MGALAVGNRVVPAAAKAVYDRGHDWNQSLMSGDTQITVVGNLTDDPELRFTPSGHAVANFTVASTPRRFDKSTNEWVDQQALFMRCSVWRQYAENVAESLQKGMQVVVRGNLVQRDYEDKEGIKRYVMELQVEDVGPTLRFATAKVTRANRGGAPAPTDPQDPYARAAAPRGGQQGGGGAPANDPWGQGGGGGSDPWGTPGVSSDEPPF